MTFKEHIETFMNKETVTQLLNSLELSPKQSFKKNLLKGREINTLLENVEILPLKEVNNAYYFNKGTDELGKSLEFISGAFYIQEPAAMLAETLLNINENDKILDMCAAPGGKTFDAIMDNHDNSILVCNDINPLRAKVLSANIEKYGFKNVICLNDDSSKYKNSFLEYFDKIILDAPCSGSGMFRKDKFAITDWSIEKVYQCVEIQKRLLEDAYCMLKGQGRLLYSTCSFSIQENEEVIANFLKNHPDMKIIPIELNKKYSNTISLNGGLRLYPFQYDGEGQVMFLLEKEGYEEKGCKKIKDNNKDFKELYSFLKSINYQYDKKNILKIGNQFYLSPAEKIDVFKYNVIRYGLHLGYLENSRFVPSHSLAMVHDIDKNLFFELSLAQAKEYIKGLQIKVDNASNRKGLVIASYKGLALGWAKLVNNDLKNHLPKGLRINIQN